MNFEPESLQLVCGDPEVSPATFSRFVLPFAYSLGKTMPHNGPPHIYYTLSEPTSETFAGRRKYFTRETARVLFDRARWAKVQNWENAWTKDNGITFSVKNSRTVDVKMAAPNLILFEWPDLNTILTSGNPEPGGKTQERHEILQIGFLFVDLYFPTDQPGNSPTIDDLLYINELFRYFDQPYENHPEDSGYRDFINDVPPHYDADCAKSSMGQLNDLQRYFERWINLLEEIPIRVNDDYYRFYPDAWSRSTRELLYEGNYSTQTRKEDYLIYADNRAYVWSAALLEDGGKSIERTFGTYSWHAHEHGHWVKLLNVDSPGADPDETHRNVREFEKEWAKGRTYHRWEEWGTWYGFSYHSGVLLAPPLKHPDPPLWKHFSKIYFDQTLLLFYLRIALFRFSQRLSILVDERYRIEDHCIGEWLERLKMLRADFTRFTILYQFPLLSNQQQAVEMYVLARKHFDIDDLFDEVKQEIDNTYEFLEQEESRERGKKANELAHAANRLVKFGIPLAAGALVTSFFGMNVHGIFNLWGCWGKTSGL